MNTSNSVPLLSVIVPVYNATLWIEHCVKGLMEQTTPPDEIIFVDDASTDETLSLLLDWQKQFPSIIRVLQCPENLGPGSARNRGLSIAKGQYVAFADVDDELSPQMYAMLFQSVLACNADVAVCGMSVPSSGKRRFVLPPQDATSISILKNEILYFSVNRLYRLSFLVDNNILFTENCRCGEDVAFSVKLFSMHPIVTCVYEPLYHYIRNTHSITINLDSKKEIFTALNDIRQFMVCHNLFKQQRSLYWKLCFNHGLYHSARCFVGALIFRRTSFKVGLCSLLSYIRSMVFFIKNNLL